MTDTPPPAPSSTQSTTTKDTTIDIGAGAGSDPTAAAALVADRLRPHRGAGRSPASARWCWWAGRARRRPRHHGPGHRHRSSGVREIVVDIGAGPVTLTGTSGTAVGIETITHGLFSASAEHVLADGVLTIRADGWGLNSYTEENIAVPAGVPVRVHTGAGDVTAVDLDVPRFSLNAGASTVDLSFRTAPQSISVATGAAGTIDIRVPDAGFVVTADAGIGSEQVSINGDPSATRSVHAETLVGSIQISPR